MIRLFKNQVVIRDPNGEAQRLLKAAQKLKKLAVLSFIISISTIGYSDAMLTNFTRKLCAINETRLPFDFSNKISMFARHNREIEERILRNYNLTRNFLKEYSQNMEILKNENTDLKKEMEKLRETVNQLRSSSSQTNKDISRANEQLLDVQQRTHQIEEKHKALSTESMNHGLGKFIWKLSEYKSKTENPPENKDYYIAYVNGPSFYPFQIGYKMGVGFTVRRDDNYVWILLKFVPGDYDTLMRWPTAMNITITLFDQSETPNNVSKNWKETPGSSACFVGYHPPLSLENSSCIYQLLPLADLKTREYIKNDTLYIGVKIEINTIEF